MTAQRTFVSVSEAVGYAHAVILHRGDIRKPKPTHGGPPPDDEAAIKVLQAMRDAGCPYDSDAGRSIIAWATAPDDVGESVDSTVRRLLTLVLEEAGLVPPPPKLPEIGWRVHRHTDGRRVAMCVPDPDPRDYSVIRAPSKSAALASRFLDVELLPSRQGSATPDDARAEAERMAEAGADSTSITLAVAVRLGVTERSAWRWRKRWASERAVEA